MRKTRNALVAALALGSVMVIAPSAMGQVSTDNTSSIEGGISPNFQNSSKAGEATLFTQVQTFDADGGPLTIVDKAAERVEVHFDNDMVFNPTPGKFKTCGNQGGSDLDGTTTSQAVAECKNAIVGAGAAYALIPTGNPMQPVAQLELTITTINGPTTVPGGPCTPPGDGVGGPEGCEYEGGHPQIILHAYEPNIPFTTTVGGEVRDSDETAANGEPYGKVLIVNDAPDTAGDAGSLILFGSTVGADKITTKVKNNNTKKEKTIVKEYEYIKATCQDDGAAGGGLEWDFRGEWIYDDNTTDSDTFRQKCGNETSTPAP
jgi:hypothetical protein